MVRLQRRDAVEGDGGVGRGVGAGALDQQLVSDLERDRQRIRRLLVQHVHRIAGRACEDARRHLRAVVRGTNRVADRLVHGLGEAAELADVEIDPARIVLVALLRDQHHFGLDDPRIPTMPRPGSMMVSGIWLPKCLRSARKIDRPYCTTGGTSFRYRVGKPPPMLTIDRLMPRSAQLRNTVEAIASARSHAFTLRCWEPTWNEMPHGSSPSRFAWSSTSTAISGSQPNLRDSGHSAPAQS